jgi:hypothetical protein
MDMSVVNQDPESAPDRKAPKRQSRACARCSKTMHLLTAIARFGDQPAYNIFRCVTCGAIDWVTP